MSQPHETSQIVALYITFPSTESARALVQALLEEQLIACANILPAVESHYRWEGKVVQEIELVAICKTSHEKVEQAIARATELHDYDVPCITVLPVIAANADYAKWVSEQLT